MDWKAKILGIMQTLKPTTVSAEDQKIADGVEAADKRDLSRKKREKADADAKAARLRWSPVEANKAMLKRGMED